MRQSKGRRMTALMTAAVLLLLCGVCCGFAAEKVVMMGQSQDFRLFTVSRGIDCLPMSQASKQAKCA